MLQLIWSHHRGREKQQVNRTNTGTYSDDDVGHIAFLGEDLQATHSLLIANHVLQLGRPVLLHPASQDNYIHILTGFTWSDEPVITGILPIQITIIYHFTRKKPISQSHTGCYFVFMTPFDSLNFLLFFFFFFNATQWQNVCGLSECGMCVCGD